MGVEENVRTSWLGKPGGPQSPTLVLMHGYGGTADQITAVLPVMSALLSGVSARVLTVQGAFPSSRRRGGRSWFPEPVDVQPPADVLAIELDRLLDTVRAHTDRAVFLGISQGMCAAILAMRRRPEMVRALVVLSGFMFDAPQPGDGELGVRARSGHGIPAFYGRDPADPRIPGFASEFALEFLRANTDLTERSYPGIGHGMSFAQVADVVAFLRPLL